MTGTRHAAEREFKRAIELNPGYATAHHWYAHYFLAKGQTEQALAEVKRARALDPLSFSINVGLGWSGGRIASAGAAEAKACSPGFGFPGTRVARARRFHI